MGPAGERTDRFGPTRGRRPAVGIRRHPGRRVGAGWRVPRSALRGIAFDAAGPGPGGRPSASRSRVRLDERSAGFVALGIGLATGRPAVVVTTSGTAAAELHPAVVEADLARVPLLVCTADRPPEVRGVGAPQTIDQTHLFGRAARWFADPGVPAEAARATWRSLAARSVAESVAGPRGPGPVHLNLPFREPLFGDPQRGGGPAPGRPDGAPWHQMEVAATPPSDALIARLAGSGLLDRRLARRDRGGFRLRRSCRGARPGRCPRLAGARRPAVRAPLDGGGRRGRGRRHPPLGAVRRRPPALVRAATRRAVGLQGGQRLRGRLTRAGGRPLRPVARPRAERRATGPLRPDPPLRGAARRGRPRRDSTRGGSGCCVAVRLGGRGGACARVCSPIRSAVVCRSPSRRSPIRCSPPSRRGPRSSCRRRCRCGTSSRSGSHGGTRPRSSPTAAPTASTA